MTRRQPDSADVRKASREARTLAIDIGGSGVKAAVLDARGRLIGERVRAKTPVHGPPAFLIRTIAALVAPLGEYDRVSVGFPGVVREGVVRTAPNLGSAQWRGFDLARALAHALKRPVRVVNDAEMHGFGVITGKGLELVITLGTGFGSALFRDGELMPHLELSQHPVHGGKTYDEYLGDRARKRVGTHKWNRRVHRVMGILHRRSSTMTGCTWAAATRGALPSRSDAAYARWTTRPACTVESHYGADRRISPAR
jgi:polyphosphate glucokinase